jgi:Lrp/AsnC family leucine-responsive transcriptional regulator
MTKLDDIDEHILRTLSRDGRISNLELAGRVGLSLCADI